MLVWRFATQLAAQQCADAVTTQLGAREELRERSVSRSRPRKRWSVPFQQLSTGQWCVIVKPRMSHVAGRGGVPTLATAVTIPDEDRTPRSQ